MKKLHDVIIVGGGPGGLHTASLLAKEGVDVLVLERKEKLGESVICTGIIGDEAFTKFNLPEETIVRELQTVELISPFKTKLVYCHPKPFAFVVDRALFDKGLAKRAERNGAVIKTGTDVLDINVLKKRVEVTSHYSGKNTSKHYAKICVLATGIDICLSRKLGLGFPRRFINGIQVELSTSQDVPPSLVVGNSVSPGGFAWMIPLKENRIKAGLLTEKEPGPYLLNLVKEYFADYFQKININLIQQKPVAQELVSKIFAERMLIVGEAAGQVKTTTGGGIFYALLGSVYASDIILRNLHENKFGANAFFDYQRLCRNNLHKEIHWGYMTRKFCSRLTDQQIESLFTLARVDGIFPLIKEKGNFDWHSDLLFTLFKHVIRSKECLLRIQPGGQADTNSQL